MGSKREDECASCKSTCINRKERKKERVTMNIRFDTVGLQYITLNHCPHMSEKYFNSSDLASSPVSSF